MKYIFAVLLIMLLNGCLTTVKFPSSATIAVTPSSVSKEDCKKSGWRSLRRSDGSGFSNQGDCVSYFASGK